MKLPKKGLIDQVYDAGIKKYTLSGEERKKDKILLKPIIDKLSVEDKKQIKELFLRYSIENIFKSIVDFKYINIIEIIKNICYNSNVKLSRFRDIFFELLDNEEERKKTLANAYYREHIADKTGEILNK